MIRFRLSLINRSMHGDTADHEDDPDDLGRFGRLRQDDNADHRCGCRSSSERRR